jgi:hypothetical protein
VSLELYSVAFLRATWLAGRVGYKNGTDQHAIYSELASYWQLRLREGNFTLRSVASTAG